MRRARISSGIVGSAPLWAIALACLAVSCTSPSIGTDLRAQDGRDTRPAEEPRPELEPAEFAPTPRWSIELRPYLWVPAMHGEVTARGTSAPVSVNTSEAFDLLKDLDGAFVLHGELGFDRWRLFGDVNFLSLEASESTPVGRVDTELTQAFTEVGIAYELVREDLGGDWQLVAEPLAGARFQYLDLEIDVRNSGRQSSGDAFWADAFGGLRFRLGEERGFGLIGRFDAGGGGSNTAWNALTGIDWSLADWLALSAGYRWLSIDYASGSGGDRTAYDVLQLGPFLGLTLRF
jgi:opacity protein-like surface antigen